MANYLDILFYSLVRRKINSGSNNFLYEHILFSFLIFLNCVAILLFIKQTLNSYNLCLWDNDLVDFIISIVIGQVVAYIYKKRLPLILRNNSVTSIKDLDLIAIGYSVFSTALFLVIAFRDK